MSNALKNRMLERAGQAAGQVDFRQQQQAAIALQTTQADVTQWLPLNALILDPRVQVRLKGIDEDRVEGYAEMMLQGQEFPPVVVFRDPITDELFLADGFHRTHAAHRAGLAEIRAEVRPGGFEAAVDYAEVANLEHGLNLTSEDKQQILFNRLQRRFWVDMPSNRQLGALFGVAHTTISRWLREYQTGGVSKAIEVMQNGGGANAPLAEDLPVAQKALKPYSGTRQSNKRRGPTTLQLRQRTLRDLDHAVKSLRDLQWSDYADKLTDLINALAGDWERSDEQEDLQS